VHLTTADGVRLAARVLPGPEGSDVCVVLAHGFGVSTRRASVRKVARALAARATVLAYDARGHGLSGGVSTLGDAEVLDVDAAVQAARGLARRVVACGWSMGGATVVRHAGLQGSEVAGHRLAHAPDAVVAVSAASRWSQRTTANAALRRLHAVVETRSGRLYARAVMRTRVATSGWDPQPLEPVDVAHRIAPVPLLVLHGDRDAFFPLSHPRELVAAARQPVDLWVEPGFGHAETAASPQLLDRLGERIVELAAPERRTA
jgi:pimeloyl-ACP methyl ester carboxylesterase